MNFKSSVMQPLQSLARALIQDPILRWGSSFLFVASIYISATLTVIYWQPTHKHSPAPPMAGMMVDLAPMPVAPVTPPNAAPPALAQKEIPPPPPEPAPKVQAEPEIEPLPELPVIKDAEAVLPKALAPESIEEKEAEPLEEAQIAQEESAPPTSTAPTNDVAAAPMQGSASLLPSQASATWQSALLGHLERHKRYPRKSRRKRQEATTYVRVKINRDGSVVDYSLEKPCAYEALNQETLALIARAQPLPPPPLDIAGDTIEFVVPVEFSLTR